MVWITLYLAAIFIFVICAQFSYSDLKKNYNYRVSQIPNANFAFLNCFKNPDYALGHPVFTNHYGWHSLCFLLRFREKLYTTEWPNANWAILIDLKNHILLWVTLYLPNIMVDIHTGFFLLIFKEKILLQSDSIQNEPFSLI